MRQHQVNVAPSLQDSRDQAGVRISVQEINMSCTLACVAGGFLLDTNVSIYTLEALFPRNGSKNCTVNNPISFISEQHNKSIYNYAARNRVFREEFRKLLCWWQVRRTSTEADSDANARRGHGEEITHTVV